MHVPQEKRIAKAELQRVAISFKIHPSVTLATWSQESRDPKSNSILGLPEAPILQLASAACFPTNAEPPYCRRMPDAKEPLDSYNLKTLTGVGPHSAAAFWLVRCFTVPHSRSSSCSSLCSCTSETPDASFRTKTPLPAGWFSARNSCRRVRSTPLTSASTSRTSPRPGLRTWTQKGTVWNSGAFSFGMEWAAGSTSFCKLGKAKSCETRLCGVKRSKAVNNTPCLLQDVLTVTARKCGALLGLYTRDS